MISVYFAFLSLGDIDVDAPYVELYVFSPRKERVNYESTFMSRRRYVDGIL